MLSKRSPDIYAGIGSRQAPPRVLESIVVAATRLARGGWTLRTGLSPGADQAFYRGAVAVPGRVELYLPCPDFEAHARSVEGELDVFVLPEPADGAYSLAARFHPGFSSLSPQERRLRARDVHEVLGRALSEPAALVVCWTQDGSVDGTGPRAGGTGQALRIAHDYGVPVLNLSRSEHRRALAQVL